MADGQDPVLDVALATLPHFAHLAVALFQQEARPLTPVLLVSLQLVQTVARVGRLTKLKEKTSKHSSFCF